MGDGDSFATWDVLRDFGFEPDGTVISDVMPGLAFDFGNFKLSASCVTSIQAGEVVLFTGVMAGQGCLAEVCFEMARTVSSPEECAAWIVWHLDRAAPYAGFQPSREVAWLAEGRTNQHLLPWVAARMEYEARPRCTVQREWLRLALNTLRGLLAETNDETQVEFSFDGSVLMIQCGETVVALAGEGDAWADRFAIPSARLRSLPKRLMHYTLEVSIRGTGLQIGSWIYDGVVALGADEPNDMSVTSGSSSRSEATRP